MILEAIDTSEIVNQVHIIKDKEAARLDTKI